MKRAVLLLLIATSSAAAGGKPSDFVEVSKLVPDAVIDMRYATADNFTKQVVYPVAVCKLRRSVATRLAKAAKLLRAKGRRLLIWDCYRPTSVQDKFWALVPDERYVANPKKGSRHSRGAAVDLGLVDKAGKSVVLPTAFDDFSEAAHRGKALEGEQGAEGRKLEAAMKSAGFIGMPTEWWHFDAPDAAKYPLANDPL
ncbi:MAG TPA: M15 family metallopeptidase [Kofleriaceae bacterium]